MTYQLWFLTANANPSRYEETKPAAVHVATIDLTGLSIAKHDVLDAVLWPQEAGEKLSQLALAHQFVYYNQGAFRPYQPGQAIGGFIVLTIAHTKVPNQRIRQGYDLVSQLIVALVE